MRVLFILLAVVSVLAWLAFELRGKLPRPVPGLCLGLPVCWPSC